MKLYYVVKIVESGRSGYLSSYFPGEMADLFCELSGTQMSQDAPSVAWIWSPVISEALLFPSRESADAIAGFAGDNATVTGYQMRK